MPTYYVEDYDEVSQPQVETKVVEPETVKPPAKKTSRAQTKD